MGNFRKKVLDLADSRVPYLSKVTFTDKIIKFLFLGLIPKKVTPNQITVFRFVTVPFIIWLLLKDHFLSASILFMFSALSDAIDGALARTTNRITRWGILADPLADKLLVGSVAVILISKFLSWPFAFVIVALELIILASAYYRYNGRVIPAKITGKIKMILQCVGIIFLFFFVLFGTIIWLTLAKITLSLAVVFALLSLIVYKSI
jgi:CDP-diacylglycerol--glycerol-3-phosphate 3-phosphatidyltransferase